MREVVARYTPEEAERSHGRLGRGDIRATAREYARERHAAIFYTLGITEHACGVDNIWSLAEPRADDRPPRLRVDRAQRAARPEQRPGAERLGREPGVLPGLPGGRRPGGAGEVLGRVGRRRCRPRRLPPRPDDERPARRPSPRAATSIGENPAQTEPNAHHVEEGLAGLEFLVSQDLFLNDSSRRFADVVLPASSFAEKDGTFTNTERRVNLVRAAVPLPGRRASTARS